MREILLPLPGMAAWVLSCPAGTAVNTLPAVWVLSCPAGTAVRGRQFILSPSVKGCVTGICILYDTFVTVLQFAPLMVFLIKPMLWRYVSKFLVTTPSSEMTKGCTDMLLSLQIFFTSRFFFNGSICSVSCTQRNLN